MNGRFRALWLAGLLAAAAAPAVATPAECMAPCHIEVLGTAYAPPVEEIASGTEVIWHTTDKSHPTANAAEPELRCFGVEVGKGVPTTPIRFDITGGTVFATTAPGTAEETTSPCPNAGQIETGDYVLPFQCLLHTWTHGALLIHE